MAKFLNTTGVSYHLEELIKSTKEQLILISPYLQFNERIKEHLSNLNMQKRDIRIVFKENKLHPEENNWLEKQIGVRTSILENLHAKCYISESEAIITSMNLYEFSQIHNNEIGIHISKAQDQSLYNSTLEEAQRLLYISKEFRVTSQKIAPISMEKHSRINIDKDNGNIKLTGYCIRTGKEISFNIEKPMSYDAFKAWDKYCDEDYPEKFCHFSGEPSDGETSVNKPILKKNWKKAQEIHGL